MPEVRRLAVLGSQGNLVAGGVWPATSSPAQALGIDLRPFAFGRATTPEADVRRVALALDAVSGKVVSEQAQQIIDFALAHRPPSFGDWRPLDCGLSMFYGPAEPALYARLADYVDKIVRGADPAQPPVERPTVYDTVLNLRTVRQLGLSISPAALGRATEVIE